MSIEGAIRIENNRRWREEIAFFEMPMVIQINLSDYSNLHIGAKKSIMSESKAKRVAGKCRQTKSLEDLLSVIGREMKEKRN
ncbi:CLUMA_CG018392, isoform A [Clunio marinus]|uniref:CLUMA_CG018392, isoform A n=1 Tax=Clunio marinus TaxID=568069 RepID=A0A1J1J1U2_9DIPT|nr:CLUMA_CG018392, isoform A [Clunio marinus]